MKAGLGLPRRLRVFLVPVFRTPRPEGQKAEKGYPEWEGKPNFQFWLFPGRSWECGTGGINWSSLARDPTKATLKASA